MITMQNFVTLSHTVYSHVEGPEIIFDTLVSRSLRIKAWLTPGNTPVLDVCYRTEFGRYHSLLRPKAAIHKTHQVCVKSYGRQ